MGKYFHGVGGGGYFALDQTKDTIGKVTPWYGLRVASPSTDQSNEVVYADDNGVYDSYAGVATDNLKITGYNTPKEAWASFGKRVLGNGLVRDQNAYNSFGVYFRQGIGGEGSGKYLVTIYYKLNGVSPTGDAEADEDKRSVMEKEHNAISVPNATALDENGNPTAQIEFEVDTTDPSDPNKALFDKLYPKPSGGTTPEPTIPLPTELKSKAVLATATLTKSGTDYTLAGTVTTPESGKTYTVKAEKPVGTNALKTGTTLSVTAGAFTGLVDGTKVAGGDTVTVTLLEGSSTVGTKTVTVPTT